MLVTPPNQTIKKSIMSLTVLLSILTVVSGLTIPELSKYYYTEAENWKAVAAYLETRSQLNDITIIEPSMTMKNFLYYYENSKNNLVQSLSNLSITELEKICRYNRVWFVYAYHRRGHFDGDGKIYDWLTNRDLSRERKRFEGIHLFLILPEQNPWLKAGVFYHSELQSKMVLWKQALNAMGASISTFNETVVISNVDVSEFDVVVFVAFKRPLNDLERLHIENAIQNGLSVVVSDVSPRFLATDESKGTDNLTKISSWFGATYFSRAPKEARWKIKFTENATDVMTNIDLNREYEYYMDFDYSTPHGCLVQPGSVVLAYRVDDGAAVIFSHKFGKGTSIFVGTYYGFVSPDKGVFKEFLQALTSSLKTP